MPLVARQPINRSWPKSMLRGCPNYFIGASLAVGLVEVIDHRMWEVLPVAAVPLYFAYRAYCAHVNRLEEEQSAPGGHRVARSGHVRSSTAMAR